MNDLDPIGRRPVLAGNVLVFDIAKSLLDLQVFRPLCRRHVWCRGHVPWETISTLSPIR